MKNMQPELNPIQALEACRQEDPCVINGWTYWLDGPQNCPAEALAPFACKNDRNFYVVGDIGDPITADSVWIEEDF
jgi:hypothetical protein